MKRAFTAVTMLHNENISRSQIIPYEVVVNCYHHNSIVQFYDAYNYVHLQSIIKFTSNFD